jgi:hypothetical protein
MVVVVTGAHCIGGWVGPRAGPDAVEETIPAYAGIQTPIIRPVETH